MSRLALVALLLSTASHAHAGITLTLDDAHPVIFSPSSGILALEFTGTIVVTEGIDLNGFHLTTPFGASGEVLALDVKVDTTAALDIDSGGTYTGLLFTLYIPSEVVPGLYFLEFGGGAPSRFEASGWFRDTSYSASVNYSVQVVPEPASLTVMTISMACCVIISARPIASRLRANQRGQ